MAKERKEQIIDNYIKDIKFYLNVGLCEGQANGSFGEVLMRHFDIIAECFKETTLIEHDLGIDLITFLKGIDPDTCFMQITDNGDFYFCGDAYYGHYNSTELLGLIRKLLFMYWELTKEELK